MISAHKPTGLIGYCPFCDRQVEVLRERDGIGAYEFWGQRGFDAGEVFRCLACGEALDPSGVFRGMVRGEALDPADVDNA